MHASRQTVVTTMLYSSGLNLSSLNCGLGLILSLVRDSHAVVLYLCHKSLAILVALIKSSNFTVS